MSFQQGLSGLRTSARALDVVSNNVANSNTVGFKAGSIQFSDVYSTSLSGASTAVQVGIGSSVTAVRQAFTQGNVSVSNNPLDMAISGNGFFRMTRPDGTTAYTRNGQFDLDKNGFVVSPIGDRLTGFPVADVDTGVFAGEPGVLRMDNTNIRPRETGNANISTNLDSRQINPLEQDPPGTDITTVLDRVSIPVDAYNYTTSITVYDSLGNSHNLSLFFVRAPGDPAPNEWQVYSRLSSDVEPNTADPSLNDGPPLELLGTMPFSPFGLFDPDSPLNGPEPGIFTLSRTGAQLGTGADQIDVAVDLSRSTQFGSANSVVELNQDGYTTGQLSGLTVNRSGIIEGRYSNGQSRNIGMVALANFTAPNGLLSLGSNLWAETADSGQPIIGAPGTGVLGTISAASVEESNIELTEELVQLIIQQRNYQANAQSIRAQDQILQTIVNLR